MAENAGASLITIHGRTREEYYSGEPNYQAIYQAKKSIKIPLIANGGIFNKLDADNMLDRTGADGIMLARGTIIDPFLISKLTSTACDLSLKQFMIKHIELMAIRYDDKRAALEFRKFISYYFKGQIGLKDLKLKIYGASSTQEIIELIDKNL